MLHCNIYDRSPGRLQGAPATSGVMIGSQKTKLALAKANGTLLRGLPDAQAGRVSQPAFAMPARVILSVSLVVISGRAEKEGGVVHLLAHRVTDLSHLLATLGYRDVAFARVCGRARAGDGVDACDTASLEREFYMSDRYTAEIKVETWDFR